MNANLTKLKTDLLGFADVVNGFTSEAVQVKVIDVVLDSLLGSRSIARSLTTVRTGARVEEPTDLAAPVKSNRKAPGATKILNQVLNTEYFNERRTIGQVAAHCKEAYQSDFLTSELSGILMKIVNEGKLIRVRSEVNNRFEYVTFLAK